MVHRAGEDKAALRAGADGPRQERRRLRLCPRNNVQSLCRPRGSEPREPILSYNLNTPTFCFTA